MAGDNKSSPTNDNALKNNMRGKVYALKIILFIFIWIILIIFVDIYRYK